MQVALQWRVAHARNAAQGQLVEDELVVAADIVTSEGRTLLTTQVVAPAVGARPQV